MVRHMEITTTEKARKSGKASMTVTIRKEILKELQIKKGDLIQVTFRKVQNTIGEAQDEEPKTRIKTKE